MNETKKPMPAFGVDRNIAIHQLSHQTGIVADYCGDDAECFRLLFRILNHANMSRINLLKLGNRYVEIYVNADVCSSFTKEHDERAFRDAITQAAYRALVAAQAGKP